LLVYKGIAHVIDTGYGTAFKLIDAGLPLTAIRRVFITHHHSDHNIDLGPMLISAWANDLGASVDVYGPAGLTGLINGYWESNRLEIETRIADDGRVDLRKLVAAHEYSQGVVLDTPDVKVTALRNMHPPIIESFALKFEFGGKTVVFYRARQSEPHARRGCGPHRDGRRGQDARAQSFHPLQRPI
jgi:ribonuclease BN (tRNA processing enzyme)